MQVNPVGIETNSLLVDPGTITGAGRVSTKPVVNANPYEQGRVQVQGGDPTAEFKPDASFWEGVKAGFHSNLGMTFIRNQFDETFEPQFGFKATEHLKAYEQQNGPVQDEGLVKDLIGNAVSPENFQHIMERHAEDKEQERLASTSTFGTLTGSLADPIELPLLLLSGGASVAVKAGRITVGAARAGLAVAGAASFGGAELANQYSKNDYDIKSTAMMTAAGALAGALFPQPTRLTAEAQGNLERLVTATGKGERFVNAENPTTLQKTVDSVLSFADKIHRVDSDLGKKIYGTIAKYGSEGAIGMQANILKAVDTDLLPFEQAMKKHGLMGSIIPSKNTAAGVRTREVLAKVDDALANLTKVHSEMGEATARQAMDQIADPMVRDLVQTYADSGFAQKQLQRMRQHGVEGAGEVADNPFYVPRKWDVDSMMNQVRRLSDDVEGIAKFKKELDQTFPGLHGEEVAVMMIARKFGRQLAKDMPGATQTEMDAMGLGMMSNVWGDRPGMASLKKLTNAADKRITQQARIRIQEATGMTDDQIDSLFDIKTTETTQQSAALGKKMTSLRKRFDFDMDETSDGFSFSEIVDKDVYGKLEKYKLQESSRIGLAHAGFKDANTYNKMLDEFADKALAKGYTHEEVADMVSTMDAHATGKPTGGMVDSRLRVAQSVAGAMHLGSSGIYNLAEYVGLAYEHGIMSTAKAFFKQLDMAVLKGLTKTDAEDLKDVVQSMGFTEGRVKPHVKLLADDWEAKGSAVQAWADFSSQYTRFANGAEFVRRHQVAMAAELISKRFEKEFASGVSDYTARLGMDQKTFSRLQRAYNKHGFDMSKWSIKERDMLTNYTTASLDHTVLSIRKGQRPVLMDTQVGKVLLPYMSFVWASNNMLTRRILQNDGVLGVAQLMVMQAPAAAIAAVANNVVNGKPATQDIELGMSKAMSSLGLFSIATDFASRGKLGDAPSIFAPVNAVGKIWSNPSDPMNIVKSVPGIGVLLPARIVAGAMSGD